MVADKGPAEDGLIGNEVMKGPNTKRVDFGAETKVFDDLSPRQRHEGGITVSFEEGVGKMLVEIENWHDAPLWDAENIKEATKTWFKFMKDG